MTVYRTTVISREIARYRLRLAATLPGTLVSIDEGFTASAAAISAAVSARQFSVGLLTSESAQLAGAAVYINFAQAILLPGEAALQGDALTITGVSAALLPGEAGLMGSADVLTAMGGALATGDAVVVGLAAVQVVASGALEAGLPMLAGSGAASVAAAGVLTADAAVTLGAAAARVSAGGSLIAGAATVDGNSGGLRVDGALLAGDASMSADAAAIDTAVGSLMAEGAAMGGDADSIASVTTGLQADDAELVASAVAISDAAGSLFAEPASINADAVRVASAHSALTADEAALSAYLVVGKHASGALAAEAAIVEFVTKRGPFLQFVGQTSSGGGDTVPLPSGWEPGDIAVVHGVSASATLTLPAGWTDLGSVAWAGPAYLSRHWYRVLQSGDSAPTLSHSNGGAQMLVYRGAPSGSTVVSRGGFQSASSSVLNMTGFTKDGESLHVVAVAHQQDNSLPVDPVDEPPGFAQRGEGRSSYFTYYGADIRSADYTSGTNIEWSDFDDTSGRKVGFIFEVVGP